MAEKTKITIAVLVAVIVVLASVIAYSFLVKPGITGYAAQRQQEGIDFTIAAIVAQIQQNGFAQIPVGNETLILIPYFPEEQSQQAQTG